jgi:ligand-binding sensor domain-containing protein/AraC-like DNA-binding protein
MKSVVRHLHNLIAKIVAFCFIVASFMARGNDLYFKQISFPNIGNEENGNPTVNAIFKDSRQFVWIGSEKRLTRFDGVHLVDAPLDDGKETAGSVTALAEYKEECILIGTNKGLYRFPNDNQKPILQKLFSDKIESVSSLLALDNNRLLVGTKRGIQLVTLGAMTLKELPLTSSLIDDSNNIIGMSRLKDAVYIITKGGLFKLDLKTWKYTRLTDYNSAEVDQTSIVATPSKVYVGTMGEGIIPYNLSTGKKEPSIPIAATVVTSMIATEDYSSLYVGTDGGGVYKLSLPDEKVVERYNHQPNNSYSPHNNQVRALMLDNSALLWIGYYQNGVDYTLNTAGAFSVFNDPRLLNSRGMAVRALSASGNEIALGTREGLVYMDLQQQTVARLNLSSLRSDMVLALLRDGNKLYVGTYGGGLSVVSLPSMAVERVVGGDVTLMSGHVFAIEKQSDNSLWVGTNTGVYQIVDNKVVNHYTSNNTKLPEGNVYEIFFDSQQKGWVCTESGVCIYDPVRKTFRTDLFPSGFPKNRRIHTVYEDSKHQLYFLPEKGSPFRTSLELGNFTKLEPSTRQETDAKAIIEDKTGAIWMATTHGIYRHDKNQWHHYNFIDGVPSQIFLQCHPAFDANGNLWFGNSDGLLLCDLSKVSSTHKEKTGIHLVAVYGNGEDLYLSAYGKQRIKLKDYYVTLSLNFTTFGYSIDDARDFEYSVDGGEWMLLNSDFTATLENIGGGIHRVAVRCVDNPGSETTVEIDMPYSWIGKLVILMAISLVILLIYIIWYHFYIRSRVRARKAAAKLAEEAKAQQAESAVKKKYSANHMSDEKCAEIVTKIEAVMKAEKPFLNSDMKIADLAALTNVSSHKLSYIFSQYMNVSFYDYVNRFRVDEFKRVVAEQGVNSLTLSALAEKAGFSSRASFFRYFKEIEGISPGEYIKNLPR